MVNVKKNLSSYKVCLTFKFKGVQIKHITREKIVSFGSGRPVEFFSQHPALHSQPTEEGEKEEEEEEKEENRNLDISASLVKCLERHFPWVAGLV